MIAFHIAGLPKELTDAVRTTGRSPQYGHPVHQEVAGGTGPCRSCLRPFRVGEEERLLFTYRPAADAQSTGAPGPVFIHAQPCEQYRGNDFPAALAEFPLVLEGRAAGNALPVACTTSGREAHSALTEMLGDPAVEYVYVRHGVAGCHIARVDRGPLI